MDARAPRQGVIDPRRSAYDGRRALVSLIITFAVAAVVFWGFYFFSPRGPDVPTGPAVEQPIEKSPPPPTRQEGAVQVPAAP